MEWKTHVRAAGQEHLRFTAFQLKVIRGVDKGKILVATSTEVSVGSHAHCDLCLTDPAVSRSHLSIEARPEGFRLRDLGSTNGTFLAGVRVIDAYLSAGADIEVGESVLRLIVKGDTVEVALHPGDRFGALIGRSATMRQVFARLARAAQSDGTILLQAESGTGKDLAAEAIHSASPRANGPFVVVDCGAIPSALMESELFGYSRGAFTGAEARRVGAFESADHGTLFLDEVGELPLELQPKLLRVLEKRTFKPLGATNPRSVDIRVIAATNRDLRGEVNRGGFREDLFFRLSVIPIRMPPLRERESDALLLAEHFFREFGHDEALPPSLRERIARHDWPGNVRELRNAVEQLAVLGDLEELAGAAPSASPSDIEPFKDAKRRAIDLFEKPYLEKLIAATDGNVSAAARLAGIDRVHLLKLLRQHHLR